MNSIHEMNYIKNNNKYIELGASTPLIDIESYIQNIIQILQKFSNAMDHHKYVMLEQLLEILRQHHQ